MTGITYVMTHPGFQSIKVGHTGAEEDRVPQLMKHGWQPYRSLRSISVDQARRIEQATLFCIRFQLGIPVHLTRAHMGHAAGWTETSSVALITARKAWELVCEQALLEQLAPIVERVSAASSYRPVPPRRQKGDTPKYHPIACLLASEERRVMPKTSKNAAKKDPS